MRHQHWRRRVPAAALVMKAEGGGGGCGAGAAGPPTLNWYVNPDSGGQEAIAARCTEAAGGAYRIAVTVLPREASEQRQQLIRRLAANDSSIDLMSIDPPYVAEFAEAGFLADVPDDVTARVSEGVVPSALAGASWRDQLVTIPFWANTQLLWYRKSMVPAGLDMTQPVTWEQLIQAAKSSGTQLAVQGRRGESLNVWFNALIESAGGATITDPAVTNPEDVQLGLADPPGVRALEVLRGVADAGVGGPALSTASEDSNATSFEKGDASFMVNWPFVWTRAQSGVEEGSIDPAVPQDYGWALYPQVVAGQPSAPPLGGINLGVGAFSRNPQLAFAAAQCIASPQNQAAYFVSDGNPAANTAAYADPAVAKAFPMASTILQSLQQAAPRPQTAYYAEVSESIQRVYHPTGAVVPDRSGAEAAALIQAVLAKEDLL